jgi:hypothetical protein
MATKTSSSDIYAPNSRKSLATPDVPETVFDDALLRGFTLDLGASGRADKTLDIYEKSVRALSDFANEMGLPGLAEMDTNAVRHWLKSRLGQQTRYVARAEPWGPCPLGYTAPRGRVMWGEG